MASRTNEDAGPLKPYYATMSSVKSLEGRIEESLHQFIQTTKADVAIVFQMDPNSRSVFILAQAGEANIKNHAVYLLAQSPVKDVIVENKPVFENQVMTPLKKGGTDELI